MKYLLDTNILSEIYKPQPNPAVLVWLRTIPSAQLHVSVISLGEIRRGIEMKRKRFPDSVQRLEQSLAELEKRYDGRIWNFDVRAAHVWGRMTAQYPNHPTDAQIAAIATVNDTVLATRNVKDFAPLGIRLVNPFDAQQ